MQPLGWLNSVWGLAITWGARPPPAPCRGEGRPPFRPATSTVPCQRDNYTMYLQQQFFRTAL